MRSTNSQLRECATVSYGSHRAPVVPRRAARGSLTKHCTKCHAANDDARTTCYACGNPLPQREPVITCRRCRTHNLASMTFCCGCTRSLAGAAAAGARIAASAPVAAPANDASWGPGNPAAWQLAERRLRAHVHEATTPSGFGARILKAFQVGRPPASA